MEIYKSIEQRLWCGVYNKLREGVKRYLLEMAKVVCRTSKSCANMKHIKRWDKKVRREI